METIRIDISIKTPIITQFLSDTFFGHFAWGIFYLYGEERLKELLKDFEKDPFIVFSDGFEKGKLPKPFLEPYLLPPVSMDLNKKYKKLRFIPCEWIFENINNISDEVLFEIFKSTFKNECLDNPCDVCEEKKEVSKTKESVLSLKNSIDRKINKTTQGLYSIKETFYKKGFEFSIYAKYDKDKISLEEVNEVLKFIGVRGYGKDKSTGKGKFEINILKDFEGKNFFEIDSKKPFYLNLSSMFKDNDLVLSYGKKFTKFPKTGGNLANNHPFKNPISMFQSGTTFLVKNYKEVYGNTKENVFNKKGYYHSGYSIGIYFGVGQ